VVKTYYCEDFDHIVKGCPVPVVIAGGPKTDSILGVFEFVYDGIQKALPASTWDATSGRMNAQPVWHARYRQ
jgi:DhnA family fructose-bisphosphate aldolase class Ia